MNKLLLIDGSSLLSSSFYGNVPAEYRYAKTDEEKDAALPKLLHTSNGIYTNGVYTMMKSMLNTIEKCKITHIAVAFDLTRDTFRKKLYPEYKAQRKEIRPELKSQFALAQEVLKEMGIPVFAYSEYEADDIIGTIAKNFEEDIPVFIWTKDQDQLQLIDENIRVWLITTKTDVLFTEHNLNKDMYCIPNGAFEYTSLYLEEDYFVTPEQIIDRKAIEGDASDNIPGIKGVGEKAVIPLLKEFGTVEGIYDYIEDNSDEDIKEMFKALDIKRSPLKALREGKDMALMCKKLATIKTDIQELKSMQLQDLELNISKENKQKIFNRLEFKSIG